MYQVTRKNKITETLQLCHADGSVAHTISVDLNVDQIAARVNKAWEVLGAAQNTLTEDPKSDAALEAYGEAVLALFDVIFGEKNREKIVSFYESNYSEMLLDLFPFINEVVMPQIREATAARREQLIAAARAAKDSSREKRGLFR